MKVKLHVKTIYGGISGTFWYKEENKTWTKIEIDSSKSKFLDGDFFVVKSKDNEVLLSGDYKDATVQTKIIRGLPNVCTLNPINR